MTQKIISRFAGMALMVLLLVGCGGGETAVAPTATLSPEIALGKATFSQHCASCHAVEPDAVIVGPSLAGIATHGAERVSGYDAEQYILLSITRPGDYLVAGFEDQMPSTLAKDLTGEELDAMVAYLMTLE